MLKNLIYFLLISFTPFSYAAKSDCKNDVKSENLVVIVDLSDDLDEPSSIAFKTLAGKIAKIAPPGGMLYVYDLNKISNINSSEVTICIPAFTKLTGDKLKERKEKEFLKIVESTFNDLSNSKNRNLSNSPIIEGIYKLTLQVFNKNGTSAKGKLLIISDLEQNTNLISFYKSGIPVYKEWQSTSESKAWTVSMPSVKFTSIVIQRAQKNPKVNLEKLRDFWLDYAGNNFQKCGFMGLNQAAVELKYECN